MFYVHMEEMASTVPFTGLYGPEGRRQVLVLEYVTDAP